MVKIYKIFFSWTSGPISTKLSTSILGWWGLKFVQIKGSALLQGEIITKKQKYITKSKIPFLQNHWANLNQTWHNASLGEWDSIFFKWRAPPFSKGDNNQIAKIRWRNLKSFVFRTAGPISTIFGEKHPWVICSNGGPFHFIK